MKTQVLMEKGLKYAKDENYAKAVRCFEDVLKKEPDNDTALYNLGEYLYEIDLDRARKCFDILLKKDPNNTMVLLGKGRTYIGSDEPLKAIELFEKAILVDPQCAEAYCEIGSIFEFTDEDKSNIYYRKALDLDDKNINALNHFTEFASLNNNLASALKYSDRALDVDSNDDYIWHIRGNIYHDQEKYTQAIDCFLKILKNDGEDDMVLSDLGKAYLELHKFKKAEKYFSRSQKLDSENEDALLGMAHINMVKKDWNKTLKYCNKISEDSISVDLYRGTALNGLKRHEEALDVFNNLIFNMREPDVMFLKMRTLVFLHKFDEALKCINEILELDPHHQATLNQRDNILSYFGN